MIRKTSLLVILSLFISQLPVYCANDTGAENSYGNTGNNYSNSGNLYIPSHTLVRSDSHDTIHPIFNGANTGNNHQLHPPSNFQHGNANNGQTGNNNQGNNNSRRLIV